MPFKLRLNKKRQYNVVSKSLFVICVELLDGTSIECTLSAESSGQECLQNVCQRLGLQQPEFFGLRYVARGNGIVSSSGGSRLGQNQNQALRSRGIGVQGTLCASSESQPMLRWVEMDRPLKRQLDKKARDPCLYLRVMYYVSGVSLLHDEMTRYHFFLQLKMDVIEGRISVSPKQAVILASYSMQAEFGNHDPERHTAEYLKDFVLFPKHLTECGDDELNAGWGTALETLTEAVICQHALLVGLPQGTAEEYYILIAQSQDGYGQEAFYAKDEAGDLVVIGVTLTGIVVGYDSKFYRWRDITNVVINKRCFGIECHSPEETVQFTFEDAAMAKYVWRMCVHQHTFYIQHEQLVESASMAGENGLPFLPQQAGELGSGENGPKGQTVVQGTPPMGSHPHTIHQVAETHPHIQQFSPQHQQLGHEDAMQWGIPVGIAGTPGAAVQRAQSTSCLDLVTALDADKLRSLLPSYRPAPDYETAMQQKYGSNDGGGRGHGDEVAGRGSGGVSGEALGRLGRIGDGGAGAMLHNNHMGLLYSSQPEIHQTHLQEVRGRYGSIVSGHYPKQYPDVARVMEGMYLGGASRGGVGTVEAGAGDNLHSVGNGALPPPAQVVHTHSTPDLDVVDGHLARDVQILHLYKPPPPYPSGAGDVGWSGVGSRGVACQSNSTPDLATATGHAGLSHGGPTLATESGLAIIQQRPSFVAMQACSYKVSESSPDLVSTRGAVGTQGYQATNAYAAIMALPSHQQEQEYQHQYHNQVQRLNQNALPQQQKQQQFRQAFNAIPEPIYENVPLPWAEGGRIEEVEDSSSRKVQTGASAENGDSSAPLAQASMNDNGSGRGSSTSTSNQEGVTSTHGSVSSLSGCGSAPLKGLPPEGGGGGRNKKKRRGVDSNGEKQGRNRKWGGLLAVGRSKNRSKTSEADSWDPGSTEEGAGEESIILGLMAMPKESVCQAIEKKLEGGQLFVEFEKLPRKRPDALFTTALTPENVPRNRYPDVLPYEDNRVRLTPSKDNKTGYINASHISVIINRGSSTLGSQRQNHHSRRQQFGQHGQLQRCPYIAAQAPLPETRTHFWRMVWEFQVNLIASLTSPNTLPSSGGSIPPSTYAPYYPTPSSVPGEPKCMEFGEFQVWNEVSTPSDNDQNENGDNEAHCGRGGCTASRLRLVHVPSRQHRRVWVLSYPHWGEQGCPIGASHFLGFLEEINSVRQQAALETGDCGGSGKDGPSTTIVLCGAGAGRTGVLLLCDILLYSLDYCQELDVARILGQLRRQRMHLVQTVAQYRFVHTLLLHYLKHSRLI
ncbi:tyrosine-protein phosphatase non-receptor type 14 isoform X2 [Ischnura elegans]|uniref:tyrosine-protein phosphatase non-receptor type 14 isoform X2 n=1 Tax=Ischnura elegans TaxID=197161 RepID=UPI001ED87471|nr:tyrosine-protein phosphatase non-receptor type 14 isoform X2 [Ischnura elegans]